MLASSRRVITFALQDFFRNFWLSFLTVTMVVLALLSINVLIVVNSMTAAAVRSIEDTIDITVYFKPEVTDDRVEQVRSYIAAQPRVSGIELIQRDQALERFKRRHENDEKIIKSLETLDENPLGASLVITADAPDAYPALLEKLQDEQYDQLIDSKDFDDHRTVIQTVSRISSQVTAGVGVMAAIFFVIAVMIIFNTIRVAVYTHREEIKAMKLVGATDTFVRAPFLLESLLYSVVALLVCIGIMYPVLGFVQPYVAQILSTNDFNLVNFYNANRFAIFGYQFLGVAIVNLGSSILAVGKYLRV